MRRILVVPGRMPLVALLAFITSLGGVRAACAIELPIGLSFGWATSNGALNGTIRPGWRVWVGLAADDPSGGRRGGTLGVHHFHFPPEPPGHLIEGTADTLQDASVATMGFLLGEYRHNLERAGRFRPFVQAGLGLGYMNFGYDAIGPDSTGLWADGVLAVDLSVSAGAMLRVMKRLKLQGELRADAVGAIGAGMMIYSVNAGPVFLVRLPGLSEMSPGWSLRRARSP